MPLCRFFLVLGGLAYINCFGVAGAQSDLDLHPHTYTHGSLLLNEFQVPKGAKIDGFELHLKGAFESISNIPAGWRISLENNASG